MTYINTDKDNIYELESATIIHDDILNNDLFNKEFADIIITSPPYNVGIDYNSNDDEVSYNEYLEFTEKWIYNVYKWSKIQARFLLNIPLDKNKGGQQSVGADIIAIAKKIGWKYHSTIVWNEGNISRRTAWGSWLSASAPYVIAPVELIVVFYKNEWKKTNGSKISDISKDDFMSWTICATHNFQKKNLKQTETGKKMFIRLYELAKKENNLEIVKFCEDILNVYEIHNINGHIEWKK